MKFEIDDFKKLAKLLNESSLTELSFTDGDKSITIKRSCEQKTTVEVPAVQCEQVKNENTEEENKIQKKERVAIKSPMVGSFYLSPSPSAEPFVKVGDVVATGQVVCIIEAMKLMNEIESEVSGKITQICVEDGQSVEYGQVLMYVE